MRLIWLIFVIGLFVPGIAKAAELLMFKSTYCEWCEVWEEEIGVIYEKTTEGAQAPLKRLDIYDPLPERLQGIRKVIYTPTFVLVESGKEIGRINGYPGENYFFGYLGELLAKLEEPTNGCLKGKYVSSDNKPTKEDRLC